MAEIHCGELPAGAHGGFAGHGSLLGFHRLYSRLLLRSAARKL